ncbi:PAS domain-containing protein [Microvirga makkahensis]|uniref:histidine kinase n=1 Tax=Microvirga makkahensis TaxID=1128670 RepID=A0A7X3MP87_9HYPH|nr:PAS domain-containing protein [Microvirga makkahensis]MXQ10696.1 PAS domain-containing protein [Microvirga makkahensis]
MMYLRDLAKLTPAGAWEWDFLSGAVTWSDAVFRLLGLEPGSVPPSYEFFVSRIHPDDRRAAEAISFMAHSGQTLSAAFRIIRPDDTVRWVTSLGEAFHDESGKLAWASGMLIDVTDLREAQFELATREARYEALVRANSLGQWRASPEGEIFEAEYWCEFTGQSEEEARNFGWLDAIHPEDADAVSATWRDAIRIGCSTQFSYRARHRTGEYRWLITKMVPIKNADGSVREWVGSSEDIHRWREAQEALRINEERLRLALEGARMATWDYDHERGHITRSANSTDIHGMGSGPASEFFARIHPDDRSSVKRALEAMLETGSRLQILYRIIDPNSNLKWLYSSGSLLRSVRKGSNRIIGVTLDITSQKMAEGRCRETEAAYEKTTSALRELEERHRALQGVAGDIVWSAGPEGKVADMPEWREFTGLRIDQIRGWGWLNAIHPADRERTRDSLEHVIDERSCQVFECRVRDRDGAYHWMRMRIAPVLAQDGTCREWIGACHKIKVVLPEKSRVLTDAPRDTKCQDSAAGRLLPWQIRAARAILGWSARELAEASGVSVSTVRRIEEAQSHDARMFAAVRSALEQAGVGFSVTPDGRRTVAPVHGIDERPDTNHLSAAG